MSAGCRGGLLLCAISAFTCRVKVKLFGALTKQEIGFFETIKTGKELMKQVMVYELFLMHMKDRTSHDITRQETKDKRKRIE